jgi:hypothetical protein
MVNANPLDDIAALRSPALVLARGNIVIETRRRAAGH